MYKHILIATDGSELAQKAETAGLVLARELKARVTALVVAEPLDALTALADRGLPSPVADYDDRVVSFANRVLWGVKERAKNIGVACNTALVKERHPAEGILETARERGCDLIVMASHGRRGISKMLLGSQAIKVVTQAAVPVLVCR
jgi:nucleotide-binding universal stress UspA family protein